MEKKINFQPAYFDILDGDFHNKEIFIKFNACIWQWNVKVYDN